MCDIQNCGKRAKQGAKLLPVKGSYVARLCLSCINYGRASDCRLDIKGSINWHKDLLPFMNSELRSLLILTIRY